MTDALLNCPFCGGEARLEVFTGPEDGFGQVVCPRCDVCGPHALIDEAIEHWNRRHFGPKSAGHDCAHPRCWIQVSPHSVFCDTHQREHEELILRYVLDGVYDDSLVVTECGPRPWDKESSDA